eukprot:13888440-Alexandrium_andersonii.AAC.1
MADPKGGPRASMDRPDLRKGAKGLARERGAGKNEESRDPGSGAVSRSPGPLLIPSLAWPFA